MTPSNHGEEMIGRFPIAIDNTLRKQFAACPRSFRNKYIEHWRPKTKSVHLHAGGAFAKGVETARKAFHKEGLSEDDSVARGLFAAWAEYGDYVPAFETPKTRWRVGAAVVDYFEQYRLPEDPIQPHHYGGGPCIEMSFAIPLPIAHPETGDPLLYVGRYDMIGEFAGALYVVDEKTTTRLGPTWEAQWDMDSQFISYCWAARAMGYPVAGAIVRGVSFLKDSYGHVQVPVYHPETKTERWYQQLLHDVERMKRCYETGYYDFSFGAACAGYSGCEFRHSCSAIQPDTILELDFKREFWSPITLDKQVLHGGSDE